MALLSSRLPGRIASSWRVSLRAATTALPKTAQQIQYSSHGQPDKCLSLQDVELPPVTEHSVVTETICAPINPADINMIEGVYPIKPTLPAVGGNEGVSKVLHVGDAVKDIKEGDWVIPVRAGMGTWRTHSVWEEADLIKMPSDIPAEYAGSLVSNPSTAFRMLRDFVSLKPGDTVIQNGATSSVSRYVMQMAKAQGINTINVVMDSLCRDDVVQTLKDLGATHVVSETFARSADMKKLVAALPNGKPKLGINNVGGKSSTTVLRLLTPGGVMVTYGGLSKEPVICPTSSLIFNDVRLVGFWMSRWHEARPLAERKAMLEELAGMVRRGELRNYFELHDYKNFETALAVGRAGKQEAKQMLKFSDP